MSVKTLFRLLPLFFLLSPLGAEETPFAWNARVSASELVIELTVPQGYYVYADTLSLQLSGRNGEPLSLAESPRTEMKKDGDFGETRILPPGKSVWRYRGDPPFRAVVSFNGCREGAPGEPNWCLPPETLTLLPDRSTAERVAVGLAELELDKLPFATRGRLVGAVGPAEFAAFLRGNSPAPTSTDVSALWFILIAVLGGILLNFTPCVLPMIPVNLIIIQASGQGASRGFRRGLCYALGMAAAYGGLGAAVVAGGAKFGDLNGSAVFNFAVSGVFLVLAAATAGWLNFGFDRFKLHPERSVAAPELAAFLLGAVAALLAGACVAPVVLSVLIFSAERCSSGDPAALLAPLALGVGMGLPWPFAGMGLAVLPKPGKFMNYVKYGFALLIFALALYYAVTGYRLLPGKFSASREFAKLENALIRAAEEDRPVLIDFYADWCGNCRKMEKVIASPEVKPLLRNFEVVRFRAEDLSDPRIRALLRHWDLPGLPAFVMLELKR